MTAIFHGGLELFRYLVTASLTSSVLSICARGDISHASMSCDWLLCAAVMGTMAKASQDQCGDMSSEKSLKCCV